MPNPSALASVLALEGGLDSALCSLDRTTTRLNHPSEQPTRHEQKPQWNTTGGKARSFAVPLQLGTPTSSPPNPNHQDRRTLSGLSQKEFTAEEFALFAALRKTTPVRIRWDRFKREWNAWLTPEN